MRHLFFTLEKMILTIDVGLKNLAMCIMDCENNKDMKSYNIHLWEVFNTLEDPQPNAINTTCIGKLKNGRVCGKKCTFQYTSPLSSNMLVLTCKTHFPKNISITPKNKLKEKKVNDYLLQDISRIILLKIKEIYDGNSELFKKVTKIFVELQPRCNNKMKLISHLIYGKFVELYIDTPTIIRFVRASQKLKAYRGPVITCKLKGSYAKRKFLSIEYTKWFLDTQFNKEKTNQWNAHFNSHSKKDDLGDVFLMAINALKIKS